MSARFRIHEDTREAVNDAARRHALPSAEIYRRAVTAYRRRAGSVKLSDFAEVCTRENTVVATAARLNLEGIDRGGIDSVVRWYLAEFDNGGESVRGMNPDDVKQNADGSFTFTGAIPPEA